MPPKTKDKKGKQEVLPVGIDFTRRPLARAEPCEARPAPRRELPVVSAHHAFEEWDDDALLEMEWGMVGAEAFEDKDGRSFLPARISARVARWVRPAELVTNKTGEDGKEEHQQHGDGTVGSKGTAGGVEKGKAGGGADKGKGKSPKGKDKGPSVEPVVLEDVAVDLQGNPLPRIFVPRAAIVANDSATDGGAQTLSQGEVDAPVPLSDAPHTGDREVTKHSSVPNTASATLPRGFEAGWSESQRRDIASLLFKYNQQQQQQQEHLPPETSGDAAATITEREKPPEQAVERHHKEEEGTFPVGDGSKEPPACLRDEDIATLGAPSGGDIDPAITAIFKAIDQLSSTVSSTRCPLLWEAIYPKTANEVPCYNPCGRYLVKLFAAGRWRRVEVDDSIPLDATGRPVIAASEDPLELWPLLLSKALYKLYRLGGYERVKESTTASAAAAATAAAAVNSVALDEPSGSMSVTVGRAEAGGNSVGGIDGEDGDEQDRARFVAFVLHSLAGWVPSITTGVSAEAALVHGMTPTLTPSDLRLPALPPVDEEAEAARERSEERKRRQALFLHKKRRPRKVERKVVSMEEYLEVDSARLRKMNAVSAKVLAGDRREVYVVCMPGEPARPVLAVCPQVPLADTTAACQSGTTTSSAFLEHKNLEPGGAESTVIATAGVGTSSRSLQAHGSDQQPHQPSSSPSVTMETTKDGDGSSHPLGFLLKWETPTNSHQDGTESGQRIGAAEEAVAAEPAKVFGEPESEVVPRDMDARVWDPRDEEAKNRVLHGSGQRRRDGHGKNATDRSVATSPATSLSNPVYMWLLPRQIELAGGTVVRALTKVDKNAYADIQYHWKLATPSEVLDAPNSASEKTGSKEAKNKTKTKTSTKDSKTAKGKGTQGTQARSASGERLLSSSSSPSSALLAGENSAPEAERSASDTAIARGIPVPKGLEGMQARDPGSPPPIFVVITPSPRSAPKITTTTNSMRQSADRDSPDGEKTVAQEREPEPEDSNTENEMDSHRRNEETGELLGERPPPTTSAAAGVVASAVSEVPHGGEVESPPEMSACCGVQRASGEGLEEEEEEEEKEEEEEAEVLMSLWADQPGADITAKKADWNASAMVALQEVLPGVPEGLHTTAESFKPVPGGRLIMRVKHDLEPNGLPFTAKSAKIRLVKGGAPRVFRVLLQPGLGCCIGFFCTHEIETGDAGQVWEEAGYNQVTETGKYDGARPGEWKILFRRSFRVAGECPKPIGQPESSPVSADPSDGEATSGGESPESSIPETAPEGVLHEENGAVTGITAATGDSTENSSCRGQQLEEAENLCFVRAILHLPDEESRPSVRLAFVDEDTGREMLSPSLHTNAIPLAPNKCGYSVLAAACGRAKAIPKGAWRLQLLSDRPLLPLKLRADGGGVGSDPFANSAKGVSVVSHPDGGTGEEAAQGGSATTVVPCQERVVYGGLYVPNKYLRLFKDVLKCASPLPFAVRLRCSLPGICLRLLFLDAATGETIRDIRGKHILQVLAVTSPSATEIDPCSLSTNEMPSKDKGKGGSKDKAAAAAAAAEQAALAAPNIIIEAVLDWEKMEVSPSLMSELPHYFQPTPEGMAHFCPPPVEIPSRNSSRPSTSDEETQQCDRGAGVGGDISRSSGTGDGETTISTPSISAATATETGASSLALVPGTELADRSPEGCMKINDHKSNPEQPVRWWLEIVGAGEVEMAHDMSRVDSENKEVESWEAATPGRAGKSALLWTQRQASKVASLGNGDRSLTSSSSPENVATPSSTTSSDVSVNPKPGEEGYEDWIKARAAAVGVPVALERERHASRLVLLAMPATGAIITPEPIAPSSGSPSSVVASLSSPPVPSALINGEELKKRADERAALRQTTMEFEKKWEADRVNMVEAGMQEMAMQLEYVRGREESIKQARLPFLRDRETIVQDLIAKMRARKEALEEERAALEPTTKGGKTKQATKGKPAKK